jgi:hypothetical protein
MATNGNQKRMNSDIEDIEADLNRIKSSGALTITPELFEKVLYKNMSLILRIWELSVARHSYISLRRQPKLEISESALRTQRHWV